MNFLQRVSRLGAQWKLNKLPSRSEASAFVQKKNLIYYPHATSSSAYATAAVEAKQETPISVSSPVGPNKTYEPKLVKMVDEISKLNLLEVSELNELLKKTLNIPDTPMMGGMMQMAGPPKEEEEMAVPVRVQTSFTLKLMKFDEAKKVPLIKECKNLLEGMNLVQAKKFVESAPTIIKADIPKDEAEKLQAALQAVGATCEIS